MLSFLRFERKGSIHKTLPNDGVRALGKPGLGQQFPNFLQAHPVAIDQVLIRTIPVSPASDRHLCKIDRQPATLLSKKIVAEAIPARGRCSDPEKIMSSVLRPRRSE